jgi:hypothetical protein
MDDTSFLTALATASKPNYLGSVALVDGFLRKLALDVLERIVSLPDAEAARLNEADCQHLTAIFLGRDTDYSPLPLWNAAGHIDRFVSQEMDWHDKTAEQVMRNLFAEFVQDWYRLVAYAATSGVPDDLWKCAAEAHLEYFRNLLLGILVPDEENL